MHPNAKTKFKPLQEIPPPHEPRWPAILASLATGLLYAALPESLSLGPRWLLPVLVIALLVPTVIAHRLQKPQWNARFSVTLTIFLIAFLLFAVCRLIDALVTGRDGLDGKQLLFSAIELWSTNVIVFTLCYWKLDAGGPNLRDLRRRTGIVHEEGCFLFPQMVMDKISCAAHGMDEWHPNFWDYLFLAFNTSTALSPTDTAVLTRPAKILMMMQASISLIILAVLASRAINILGDGPQQPTAPAPHPVLMFQHPTPERTAFLGGTRWRIL